METTDPGAAHTSFRPTNLFSNYDNVTRLSLRRDHLFTPALSQDALYTNQPHCIYGHDMYCNGKFYNYTLDGGQNYWGYDEFQTGVGNYADGYGYGYGYDHFDGAWYDIPEKLCHIYPEHHKAPYTNALNIPSYFQGGDNRELYVKMSRYWQNLDNQTPLPADQCYTVYLDVRSASGNVMFGLANKEMYNRHHLGYGHPIHGGQYRDHYVAFYRNGTDYGFIYGELLNGSIPGAFELSPNRLTCSGASCTTPTNFIITITVCNQTTISFQETNPLGSPAPSNYNPDSYTFNVDLRGNGSIPTSIDVVIAGEDPSDAFVVTAKSVPKVYTAGNERVVYGVVMGDSQLNPTNFNSNLSQVATNAVFQNNQLSFTSNVQYTENSEPIELDLHTRLVCFNLDSKISSGRDYLVDIGVFAESFPADQAGDKSLAVGFRQNGKFVGFNRLGYYHDSLGNVITADVSGDYLVNITRMDSMMQNRPGNGIVQNSNMNAPHFNVRFAIYGASGNGVSIYAGTPDSPPYTFVWAAVENNPLDFSNSVDLCFYHQAESVVDLWDSLTELRWKNITTILNGITISVENAEFGCDGQDLSGAVEDGCGVCGGKNDCYGCQGPYSGVLDACGVCNGRNDTCCHNRFGISNAFWDWLLLPHIIDDVSARLNSLSTQLTTTCSLLDSFSNLCNPVDAGLVDAFDQIDLTKFQVELNDFYGTCLSNFTTSVNEMVRDISVWVPINHYGRNL